MGALHDGHLQLINTSITENDYTLVSIFVNRLQFNNVKDFDNYPIETHQDILKLEKIGCDAVFIPNNEEMFPKNFKKVSIDLEQINSVLEGPLRPGHFDGVVQVVHRLFDYLQPDNAYFGLKDYQQCIVIKNLKNLYFPNKNLKFCPTIREESGLAMSSRNENLSAEGRKKAKILYEVLQVVKNLSTHIEGEDALNYGKHLLQKNDVILDYLELANSETLKSSKKWLPKGKNAILIAAYVENIRLIDNIIF
jgi:pantoate--beta-alanine ligase